MRLCGFCLSSTATDTGNNVSLGDGLVATADPHAAAMTIHLIEPDDQERQRLEVLLKHYYEDVAVFDTTGAFIAQISAVTSGCVVISSATRSSEMTALEFVRWLKCTKPDLGILVLGDEHNVSRAVSLLMRRCFPIPVIDIRISR